MIKTLIYDKNKKTYINIDESKSYIKGKFFTGGKSTIKIALSKSDNTVYKDILLCFTGIFTNLNYSFLKESSESNRVFITDTKTEKRAFISVTDSSNSILKPDDEGYFYLMESWNSSDNIKLNLTFEIEKNFTSSYTEEATLKAFNIIVSVDSE